MLYKQWHSGIFTRKTLPRAAPAKRFDGDNVTLEIRVALCDGTKSVVLLLLSRRDGSTSHRTWIRWRSFIPKTSYISVQLFHQERFDPRLDACGLPKRKNIGRMPFVLTVSPLLYSIWKKSLLAIFQYLYHLQLGFTYNIFWQYNNNFYSNAASFYGNRFVSLPVGSLLLMRKNLL